MASSSTGLSEHVAKVLAYLFGWLSGLVLLLLETGSVDVRWHAAQSLLIFGVLTLLNLALPTVPVLGPLIAGLLGPVSVVLWLLLVGMSLFGRAPRVEVLAPLVARIEQTLRPRGR